jgi:hypothetical protein
MFFSPALSGRTGLYEKKHNISDHFALEPIRADDSKVREALPNPENQDTGPLFFLSRNLRKRLTWVGGCDSYAHVKRII